MNSVAISKLNQEYIQKKGAQPATIPQSLEQKPDTFEKKAEQVQTKKEEKLTFKQKVANFFNKSKTVIVAALASLVSIATVLAVTNKKNEDIKNENEELRQEKAFVELEKEIFEQRNKSLAEENFKLEKDKTKLEQDKDRLEKDKQNLEKQLADIQLPEDFDESVDKKLDEINKANLGYNAEVPELSQTPKEQTKNKRLIPEVKKTSNRSDASDFHIPPFVRGQKYELELPTSKDMKITTCEKTPFIPIPRTNTNFSESYADSVVWSSSKVARDILQNFYDGHGQTLNGVKFSVTPNEDGTHKVRIEGKSTYSPEKAIFMGETSKRNDKNAAGNYGEGSKMVALKLLKDWGAQEVNIGSNDWNVSWKLQEGNFDKKVLTYQLDQVSDFDGNYLEFNTKDPALIDSLIKSFNNFYHYDNPDFNCPDFENDIISFKLLDAGEKGRFYIAGQAFELEKSEAYQNMPNISINIKQKPPEDVFSPSRDRIALNAKDLEKIAGWIARPTISGDEDCNKMLFALEKYWEVPIEEAFGAKKGLDRAFCDELIKWICVYKTGDDVFEFPEKYVAKSPNVTQALEQEYRLHGYKVCNPYLEKVGMTSLDELIKKERLHKALKPTKAQENKIKIIKSAIELLAPILTKKGLFNEAELKPKIYLFNAKSTDESKVYKNVQAEAIVDAATSKGFWIDKEYLDTTDFSSVLSTALHELTHKFGGDESSRFSYKLTDVMEAVFAAINENPNLALQLKVLEEAWKKQ